VTGERWLRLVLKPLVYLTGAGPFLYVTAGIAGVAGVDLGANPVEKILDTLGIWGLYFLLATLAVTPLRQATGWVPLAHLRRPLGLAAFFAVLGHFLFYLAVDRALEFDTIGEDIFERPFITVGLVALLILVPLALTSTRRAMRRLGRRWQTLHRLVYVAAFLGCLHYAWQVKADLREPLLCLAILAFLLGWRWVRHQRRLGQVVPAPFERLGQRPAPEARRSPRAASAMPSSTSAPPSAVAAVTASPSSCQASRAATSGSPVRVTETKAGRRCRSDQL
jgi:sulfoxide reductase heme-binding subunit YedZ